ncbi:hypothetical protein AYL99_06343 [Fonsecaea erecta]|uniref:Uncharacterized protein n=1 Tax=Fonsecaea erecta TaxID=1367422 RepID=A0A178ZJ26_9EURO|nr:hypothetical protein AYL99_06343 [Fonsecaea erecta]OAP59045.1 hypothetical protein AYL99_06343 [Fonsecaea erecta]
MEFLSLPEYYNPLEPELGEKQSTTQTAKLAQTQAQSPGENREKDVENKRTGPGAVLATLFTADDPEGTAAFNALLEQFKQDEEAQLAKVTMDDSG